MRYFDASPHDETMEGWTDLWAIRVHGGYSPPMANKLGEIFPWARESSLIGPNVEGRCRGIIDDDGRLQAASCEIAFDQPEAHYQPPPVEPAWDVTRVVIKAVFDFWPRLEPWALPLRAAPRRSMPHGPRLPEEDPLIDDLCIDLPVHAVDEHGDLPLGHLLAEGFLLMGAES